MANDLDVIIAGGGRVGFQTASILANRGTDVTIVEPDQDVVDDIAEEWVATVIHGDASDPEILTEAGVTSADVVAALTGITGLNLAICMAAKEMQPEVRTVTRIGRGAGGSYERFVDAVIFPEQAGAQRAANEIVGSDVETLADVTGNLDIMQIRVQDGAPAAGKQLTDIRFPAGTLIVSDDDGERVAGPETTLSPGKRYVVAVEPQVVDEVLNLMRG